MKFVLKWLLNGVIVVTMLMYYAEVSFINAALTATVLTLIAYFVGDQMILRATNNAVATISDAVLAFAVLWGAAYMMDWPLSFGEALIITAILGIAEWFLHRYVFRSNLAVRA
ncbi:DUF2512 family protein [Cohnella sp.]|uniref:DUF2512 family protein n=1 Tax=Cohnella sp. TaxID=1883426 RepID=UPI003564EB7A